jgi:hypothetical protein
MTTHSNLDAPGTRDATAAALLRAFQQSGCPICGFVAQGVQAYLARSPMNR